jgi:hypothetical protein
MALNNFEKQVQQKLNNREIKPSANSWDRLDAMLSVDEKPKKGKRFFWLNIAASFIILASIGYYFYNQNSTIQTTHEESIIVDIEKKDEKSNQKESETIAEEVLVTNDKIEETNKTSIHFKSSTIKNKQSTKNNLDGVSNINQSTEKNNKGSNLVENLNSATQNQQPTTNKYISAEKLLADVSNVKYEPKNSEKINQRTRKGISVNPNSLLSNAETELNHSYRESALDKLNKNFNSVKTVLANRNYQE